MFRNIVAMMYALLTVVVMVIAFLAGHSGIAEQAWTTDTTYFTTVILGVAAAGFVGVTVALMQCSHLLDYTPRILVDVLRLQLDRHIEPLEWIAYVLSNLQWLALIWGLIGGIADAASMNVGGAEGAVQMAQVVFNHFAVALWPAIVSVVCYLVLQSYVVLLRYGHNRLYAKVTG